MMKKQEFQKMVWCILLAFLMIMGMVASVYGNGFEKPGQPGDEFESVGKSMSGILTAVLEPIPVPEPALESTNGVEPCPDPEEFLRVTFVFVGSCGKEPFAVTEIHDTSSFVRFDMTEDELVGLAISGDILNFFPHNCYLAEGYESFFSITKVKNFIKKLNYSYEGVDNNGDPINLICNTDPTVEPYQPYGFIGAEVTVEYFVIVGE